MDYIITISFSVKSLLLWGAWIVAVLVGVLFTVETFREMEPKAGKLFGVLTVAFAVPSLFLVRYLTA